MVLGETGKPRQPTAKAGSVSRIVDGCLSGRGKWPVSVAGTITEVRSEAPDCDLADRELADLITIRAVETGCDVIFDADLLDDPQRDLS